MTDTPSRLLRVFLCHASEDKEAVRILYQKLKAEGWIAPWLDEEDLIPGQIWDYEIKKALDNSDAVIATLSNGSVSKEGYVQKELRFVLEIALEKPEGTIYILPVRLDDCQRPSGLRPIQGVDYFPPEKREQAYVKLLQGLRMRARSLGIEDKNNLNKRELRYFGGLEFTKIPKDARQPDIIVLGDVYYDYYITTHFVLQSEMDKNRVNIYLEDLPPDTRLMNVFADLPELNVARDYCKTFEFLLREKGELPKDWEVRLPDETEWKKAKALDRLEGKKNLFPYSNDDPWFHADWFTRRFYHQGDPAIKNRQVFFVIVPKKVALR